MSDVKQVLTKVARYPWDTFSVDDGKAFLSTNEGDVLMVQASGEGSGSTGYQNANKALEKCKVGNIKVADTTATIGHTKIELDPGADIPGGFDFDHAAHAGDGYDVIPELSTVVAVAGLPSEYRDAYRHVMWDQRVVLATDGFRIHGIEYPSKLTNNPLYTEAALMRLVLQLKPQKFAVYPEGVYFWTPNWAALLANRSVENFPDWTHVDRQPGWEHFVNKWSEEFATWFVKMLRGLHRLSYEQDRGARSRVDFTGEQIVFMGWGPKGRFEWTWTMDAKLGESGLVGTAWSGEVLADALEHVTKTHSVFNLWTPEKGGAVPHKIQLRRKTGPKPFALIVPLRV